MSDATKILIVSATIIIVCVLVALGFKMINEGRASSSSGINEFNDMASEYSDIRLSSYDGSKVLGSEVVDLIKKSKDKKYNFEIVVYTKENISKEDHPDKSTPLTYNAQGGATSSDIETTTNNKNYINPNAQFLGEVEKNENGIITRVIFTQAN